MPLYRHKTNTVFFVHIPKTGGSTIERMLQEAGAAQALKSPLGKGFGRCTLQHMHADLYTGFVEPGFYDLGFTVLRNPYARLASEYRWTTRKDRRRPSFDRWLRQALKHHLRDPYHGDNHFRPQADFMAEGIRPYRF